MSVLRMEFFNTDCYEQFAKDYEGFTLKKKRQLQDDFCIDCGTDYANYIFDEIENEKLKETIIKKCICDECGMEFTMDISKDGKQDYNGSECKCSSPYTVIGVEE